MATPALPSTLVEVESLLERLHALLVEEDRALRALDINRIGVIADAKIALEPAFARLSTMEQLQFGPSTRARLLGLREDIRTLGHQNLLRLRASLDATTSLVTSLTGTSRQTYGPSKGWQPQAVTPVLTSEVG